MGGKCSGSSRNDQRNSQALEQMDAAMAKAGFVPGSQTAYARALVSVRGETGSQGLGGGHGGRRYLSKLKQSGVSATLFGHASSALRSSSNPCAG